MKKKTWILGASALLCLGAAAPLAVLSTRGNSNVAFGEEKTYALKMEVPSLTVSEDKKLVTMNTEMGNPVSFTLNNGVADTENKYFTFQNGGWITNADFFSSRISGIQTIKAEIETEPMTLYYGDESGVLKKTTLKDGAEVSLAGASYFKLVANDDTVVYSISLTYTCLGGPTTRYLTSGDTVTFDSENYVVDSSVISWRQYHLAKDGAKMTISDFFPDGYDNFKVTDGETEKYIKFYKAHALEGSNVIHFAGETRAFALPLPSGVKKAVAVSVNDKFVPAKDYTIKDGKLMLTYADADMAKVNAYLDNGECYRYYVTSTTQEKRDRNFMLNAFGAGNFVEIDSLETWKSIFDMNGSALSTDQQTKLSSSAVYFLTADIDFAGEEIEPIGFNKNNADDTHTFNGQIYGNGHSIKNYSLKNTTSWYRGLFHSVDGCLYDLNLENADVETGAYQGGALCGRICGEAKIDNVNVVNATIIRGEQTPELNGGLMIGGLSGDTYVVPTHSTYNGYPSALYAVNRLA